MDGIASIGSQIAQLEIVLKQGNNSSVVLEFKDDMDNPIPLEGYDVKMEVRLSNNRDSEPVLVKTLLSGLSISSNILTISFGDDTTSMAQGIYFFDMLFIKDGIKNHLVEGQIIIKNSITI